MRAKEAWRIADARYDLRARWAKFDAPQRWSVFDAHFGVSRKAAVSRDKVVRFSDRSGLTSWGRRREQKLQVWLHGQVEKQAAPQAARSQ